MARATCASASVETETSSSPERGTRAVTVASRASIPARAFAYAFETALGSKGLDERRAPVREAPHRSSRPRSRRRRRFPARGGRRACRERLNRKERRQPRARTPRSARRRGAPPSIKVDGAVDGFRELPVRGVQLRPDGLAHPVGVVRHVGDDRTA
jgi:hypothetical protein